MLTLMSNIVIIIDSHDISSTAGGEYKKRCMINLFLL